MQRIEVSRIMQGRYGIVEAVFWDIEIWKTIWTYINSVMVKYSDGRHQEFFMSVWRDDHLEEIRTIRFRNSGSIDFFSPTPPPMMAYHRGEWKFFEDSDEATLVMAAREYDLLIQENEDDAAYKKRCEMFSQKFKARLASMLENFGEYFQRTQR